MPLAAMPLKVIFEDNHLFVVCKPSGLLTQPSGRDETSLESLGKAHLGRPFLEAAHRLDRAASGIVIFAKTSKALSRLMGAIREGKMDKTYLAWVEGALREEEGILEDHLIHQHHRAAVAPHGKLSRLSYKKIKDSKKNTLYEVHLETGRYHQIRIQFASRGAPIIGDVKYGALPIKGLGIELHHWKCTIPHPITKTPLTFRCDPEYAGGYA